MTTDTTNHSYSISEEWMNSLSHGLGFVIAIVGLVMLVLRADSSLSITASAIYGASLILMFLASTLYHAIYHQRVKRWFKVVDHSAIYLLIAGTQTPFLLLSVGGWLGWSATILSWTLAIGGVVFKCLAGQRFPKLSVASYLLMGWLAVLLIYPLYQALPGAGLTLLVAGGLCFSIGVGFYLAKKVKYTHSIWHLFVIAGCSCHYFSIYYFVV